MIEERTAWRDSFISNYEDLPDYNHCFRPPATGLAGIFVLAAHGQIEMRPLLMRVRS